MAENNDLRDMDLKIKQLNLDIRDINNKLDIIINLCTRIDLSCSKNEYTSEQLVNHINFIENVYGAIRTPLNFIKKKVAYIMGDNVIKELPAHYTDSIE